jgi:hypothetical protein
MLVRAFGVDDAGLKGFWQQGRKIAIAEAASCASNRLATQP